MSAHPSILPGGSIQTAHAASTGQSEIELVIRAARRALVEYAPNEGVSARKVNRITHRFFFAFRRSHVTFHEFLSDKANQRWAQGDPVMLRTIAYLDPTGDKAARNVDRERLENKDE